MDLNTILKKYFGLTGGLDTKKGTEAYETLINCINDIGLITDKFNANVVISDLDKI
jgi:hypothetical protein